MRMWICCALAAFTAVAISCGSEPQSLPTAFEFTPPPTPTNFVVIGGLEQSLLRWHYDADARGSIKEFRVYMYVQPYNTIELIGRTTDTVFVDSLLIGNLIYCYQVSAVDTSGFEGWRTDTACAFVGTDR
jgi:hypothetical protein